MHESRTQIWAIKWCKALSSKKEFSGTVQGTVNNVSYFTNLKRLWSELDSLNSNIKCNCMCICEGTQKLKKSLQDQRLVQFFMDLNDTCTRRSNSLMINPLPYISHIYFLIL